jgi:cytochrome c oxidase subunit 4
MLIRSLPRAAPRAPTTSTLSCTRKPISVVRTYQSVARPSSAIFQASQQPTQTSSTQQSRSAHAISNPTLAGIEKRWEGMPPQEQAELWMQLRDRMKVDWHELTLQEKKAGMSFYRAHRDEESPMEDRLRCLHTLSPDTALKSLTLSVFDTNGLDCSLVDCIWPTWSAC